MNAEIEWKEPPAVSTKKQANDLIAEALRANPGVWAVVRRGCSLSYSQNIRRGLVAAFRPAGEFEALSRTENDEVVIYARYIGGVA